MSKMNIVKKLKKEGFTKWRISKELNVSWNTVNHWDKGTFKPTEDKIKVLRKLLEKGVSDEF